MKSSITKTIQETQHQPAAPEAAQADLLGEAADLKPPKAPDKLVTAETDKNSPTISRPAEDENQPGFIGERNVPHP